MPEVRSRRRQLADLADTNPETLGAGADIRLRFKYVDLSSVSAGTIRWNSAPDMTLLSAPSRARRVLRQGDVLFGTVRPRLQSHGYVDWTDGSAIIGSTGFSVIRARRGVSSPRYLFHCIMSSDITAQADRDAVGSSYPALNDSNVRRFEVFAPSFDAQIRIAEVLDTLETNIRQTETIIEKLEQVKQGLLHDLLTRGIDANGELRPPQRQAPHLYKESLLGWIPTAWSALGLCEMASPNRTVLRTGPFGSSLKGEHLTESGRPVVTIGSLGVGRFLKDELLYVSEATARALADFELVPGDIAFSRVADVGRAVVVGQAERGWIMSSNFMRISVDSSRVAPAFLQSVLAYDTRVKAQVRSTVNSAGRDVASSAILMALRFAVPPIEEQGAVVARTRALDERIDAEVALHTKLLAERRGLMDDLLTGRVRVTPLLDPATSA